MLQWRSRYELKVRAGRSHQQAKMERRSVTFVKLGLAVMAMIVCRNGLKPSVMISPLARSRDQSYQNLLSLLVNM